MNKKLQRTFIIGDNWLYFKIYTGTKTADFILINIINPVVKKLIEQNIIDKWFFIRYGDPKNHLRIRFHFKDRCDIGILLNMLKPYFEDLIKQDLVWKIQTDSYQRELERYGENTMELSEEIFFHDSSLIVDAIVLIGVENEELRWLFALKSIDNFLNIFGYSIENKLLLFEHLKKGFGQEFGINKDLNKQMDLKYRKYRYQIENILTLDTKSTFEFVEIIDILNSFNKKIKLAVNQILEFNNFNLLTVNLDNLMMSYIHMSMVRLFKSKNRMHEMVIYDFLYRYYKSIKARKEYDK